MSEEKPLPPIGGLRTVEVRGVRLLARDIARQDGTPVAVTGPGAVDCRKCRAESPAPCRTSRGKALDYAHIERVAAANREVRRIMAVEEGAL